MEYAIFPMKSISISQGFYLNQHHAFDLTGSDENKVDYFFAPCTVKVLNISRYNYETNSGLANTVFFGTCDVNGNKTPVMCEDGIARVLTFACSHIDKEDLDFLDLHVGQVIGSGYACYREGTTGNASGPHIHLEVGLDWQTSKNANNRYELNDTIVNGVRLITNTFHSLSGFNTPGNKNDGGTTFSTVSSRKVDDSTVNNVLKMHLTGSAARLRNDVVNGNILTTIPNGTTFEVVGLYSWNASDGYKWGWGKYNGVEGYFQYDPAVMNPVGYGLESFKMRLTGSAARLRSTIQETILTTVPNGSTIQIDEFIDGKQSDGYQWCYGHYNGTYGYFQYDPAVMYPTND